MRPGRRALCVGLGVAAFGGVGFLGASIGDGRGVGAAAGPPAPRHWHERRRRGFGTELRLLAGHEDLSALHRALDAAEALLARIESQMSLFDPASALSRLNATGHLDEAPAELLAVLRAAREVSARSDGAFDITVQPLWALWARCTAEGRRPRADELAAARALVGWRGVALREGGAGSTSAKESVRGSGSGSVDGPGGGDRAQGLSASRSVLKSVSLAQSGMGVTLNGIAQGYAADAVRELLQVHGIRHALLDTGEWASLGRAAGGQPWRLGVEDPLAPPAEAGGEPALIGRLMLDGRAVATSSAAHTRFDLPGDEGTAAPEHHHLFDPRTGRSPAHLASVTVVAGTATLADALTKVLFMGTPAQALQAARRWGVDALLVDRHGACWATPGLHWRPENET